MRARGRDALTAGGTEAAEYLLTRIREADPEKADVREAILDTAWAGLPGWRRRSPAPARDCLRKLRKLDPPMTLRETAAFNAGIAHAAEMARIAAVTIETRDDARTVRQQAAAAALHGLADGLKQAVSSPHRVANGVIPPDAQKPATPAE